MKTIPCPQCDGGKEMRFGQCETCKGSRVVLAADDAPSPAPTSHWVTCLTCFGDGMARPSGQLWACKECGGTGRIERPGPAGGGSSPTHAFHCMGCGQNGFLSPGDVHACPKEEPSPPTLEERKVAALESIAASFAAIVEGDGEASAGFWASLRTALDTEERTG